MRRLALAALALLVAATAHAHLSSVSYHDVAIWPDGQVVWTVRLAARDLYEALGLDRERDATAGEIRAGQDRLARYVAQRLVVSADGRACPFGAPSVTVLEQTMRFAELRLPAACALPIGTLHLESHLFFDVDPRHSGLLRASYAGRSLTAEFSKESPIFDLTIDVGSAPSLGIVEFVGKGMEHIYTGYDHIAFLLGLLLVAAIRREPHGWAPRPFGMAASYVVKVVTSFTLAHSLTLILAALDVVQLPSRFVESAIAASIVAVAVENLAPRDARRRWILSYAFGLVHGLGFAAMLRPLLPPTGVVVPLLAFNVGVELGQLTIVAAVLPFLLLAARAGAGRYRRLVVVGGSSLIALLGALWLVERVADVRLLGGLVG